MLAYPLLIFTDVSPILPRFSKKAKLSINDITLSVLMYYFAYSRLSGQLPTRTIPHCTGIGPDEGFYSVVVVLVGRCPGGK